MSNNNSSSRSSSNYHYSELIPSVVNSRQHN